VSLWPAAIASAVAHNGFRAKSDFEGTSLMPRRRILATVVTILFAVIAPGCFTGSESEKKSAESPLPAAADAKSPTSPATPPVPKGVSPAKPDATAKNGTSQTAATDSSGLEPFKAPTLAELDAKADWQPQPVLDGLELLREKQAQEPPLCTVAEALALHNTSPQANRKILSALGRLPAKDADVDWDATLIRHLPADLKSTNPVMQSSAVEMDVVRETSLGFFDFDWKLQPFASKATVVSWHTSKDRLCDKIVLRKDLTWSDGHPITAHDVVFSFKLIMDPHVPVPAVRSGTDQIRWIEAYDDYTFVIFHKEAAPTNVWNVNFPIVPQHIYEHYDDDPTLQNSPRFVKYENNPISGGPYILKERRRNEEIVLERRESWYMHDGKHVRSKPYFKTIRYRILPDANTSLLALKNGDIEEMQLIPISLWGSQTTGDDFYKDNTKVQGVEWTEFHFAWNCQTPFFSDKRVRTAMSYAFDYDEMLNSILNGLMTQSVGMFHPDSWMSAKPSPQPYKQDLDKAEALLKEAGWEDHDGDGIRDKVIDGKPVKFDFDLLCASSNPDGVRICTLMKQNLDRLGILCNVRPLEFTVLQETELKHKFQAAFAGWGAGTDPDTSENIYSTKAAVRGRNFGSYSNPEVDELYLQGKTEFDRARRAQIYGKIHRLVWDDQPYTWLYTRNALYAFNKKLRGYSFSPRGPYLFSPGLDSLWKPVSGPSPETR
jgi:peptide/nickel transport system substrate-binding protein